MAKIWYSVFGEGFGHSTRSEVVLEELLEKDEQTGQEIADKIKRDKTKVALRLIRLEVIGLIKREPKVSQGHKLFNSIKSKNLIKNFFKIVNREKLEL